MARDDNVIENDVVKISPDLTGFREKLDAELKKAVAKVSATVKIKLVADAAGFNDSAKTALAKQAVLKNKPTYKIQLVADAKGFNASARAALKKAGISSVVAGSAGTKSSGSGGSSGSGDDGDAGLYKRVRDNLEKVEQAEDQAHSTRFSRTRSFLENVARAENAAYSENAKRDAGEYKRARNSDEARIAAHESAIREDATRTVAAQSAAFARVRSLREALEQAEGKAQIADHLRTNTRIRDIDEKYAASHLAGLAENAARETRQVRVTGDELTRLHDIANKANARLDAAATKVAERESETRVRSARREADERQKAFNQVTKGPQLIALGQSGIQPMNLLRAAVLALSPALFAVGASALQASTSIAALGAAGYGAGLGIAALAISFKGLTTVLALRKSVLAEQAQKAANAGTAADTLTAAIDSQRDAQDALTAAQRDEKRALADVHDARLQAAKDLVNLKQKVRDLQNQEKSDSLSVAEAKDAQAVVSRNYFATGLEKARATQDVNDAITRASDTRLDLKTSTGDLKTAVRKGVEGSPTVVNAKDRASDATRTRKRAQTTLKRASTATKKAGSGSTVSSAQANLDKELKQHSSAFRDLYGWIDKNADKFKLLRNRIEQATLPGFTTFLDDITQKGKIKGSIVDIVTDGIAGMGTQISKTAKKAGKFFSSNYFKGAAKKLNGVTERAFGSIGGSSVKLLKPLTQIFVAASPLLEKFADGFGKFADWFATVIDKAQKSGALQKWFQDAGTEAGKWLTITKNLITFVGNLFKLSLPTGNSLVQRFSDFTGQLASWSGSDSGKKQITDFFNFFKDLNYGDVAKIVGSAVEFFAAYRIASLVKASPLSLFYTAFATFLSSHPKAAADAMSTMAGAIQNIVKAITDHPKSAATLLAIFAAAKAAKTLDIGLKLPGVDNLKTYLTSKFSFLEKFVGDQKTAVMNVQAGVVNINGGTGTGAPTNGTPPVVTEPGARPATEPVRTPQDLAKAKFNGEQLTPEEMTRLRTSGEPFKNLNDWKKSLIAPFNPVHYYDNAGGVHDTQKQAQAANKKIAADKINQAAGAGNENRNVANGGSTPKKGYVVGANLVAIRDEATAYKKLNDKIADHTTNVVKDSFNSADNNGAIQDYITARKNSVKATTDATGATQGSSAATKVSRDETNKSRTALSNMLQQMGWTKTAADKYAASVYTIRDSSKDAAVKTDSLGNSYDTTRGKADKINTRIGVLSDTITTTEGDHVIILATKGYAEVKKQLDMLYAIQHVLYNPAYSNSAAGADTVSSQNQYLDPKTGLPKTYMKADGGHIIGPGTATSDSIPARLSNGEYVMPTKAVQHYGVGVMDAMRSRQIPTEYAAGGPVGNIPMTVNLPLKGFTLPTPDRTGNTGSSVGASDISGLSSSDRVANAQVILDVGSSLKATDKEKLAAIETAWVESKLINLSGGDRDSVGLFQQRPSQGWGTVRQLMNPRIAAAKFYRKLFRVWSPERTPGLNAQAVQLSGYPLRYDQAQGIAQGFINQASGGFAGATGSKKNLIEFGHWLQSQGYQVSENPLFGGVTPGAHVKGSTHYTGDAIDVNRGAGTSKREQAWLTDVLADAHSAGLRTIFMAPGHYNHLHVDDKPSASIGRTTGDRDGVNFRAYDTGGDLPPGYTLAYNGTGKTETVRTHKQEQALTAPAAVRLDRRDIALLAQHLGMVLNGQTIHMDGRKVAEATTRYNYLPAGV